MSKFKAYGNWVAVKTVFKEEHISEAGILYKDDLPDHMMTWSEVVSTTKGSDVSADIVPATHAPNVSANFDQLDLPPAHTMGLMLYMP